jgi:hypothetical protein
MPSRVKNRTGRLALGLSVLAALCTSGPVEAQSGIDPYEIERVGQSGWQFLKINGDARQAALGGAFGALGSGGANGVFGNPAVLAYVEGIDVALNRTEWIADIGYSSVAVAKDFGALGVVGASVASLSYGDMIETVNSPIEGQGRTEAVVTGNTFSADDMAAGVSYARRITGELAVGGSARLVREQIADVSMTNWSLDFGTSFYTGFRSLRIAFAARNFGPDSRFVDYSEELQAEPVDVRMPVEFRFGTAVDFLDGEGSNGALTLSTGVYQPNDGPPKINTGAEYRYLDVLALRGGYRFNYDEQDLTLGAGVSYSVAGYSGRVDYAYLGFGALGNVHSFSVGIRID